MTASCSHTWGFRKLLLSEKRRAACLKCGLLWRAFVWLTVGMVLALPLAAQPPAQEPEPHTLFASGVGFNQAASPRLNTWYVMGVRIGPGSYATSAVDFTEGRSSLRAGFEQVLLRLGGVVITTKGEAGMATTALNFGSAFSGGGSVLVPVEKVTKIPGSYLIGSVTILKTSVGSSNPRPIYRFGFGGTF